MSRLAYAALLFKAREIGWPRIYRSDLFKHDRKRLLAPDAPTEFCWSVREAGTWFYSGESSDLWRLLYWELRCSWGSRFFHWNGQSLQECSFLEAIMLVEGLEAQQNRGAVSAEARSSAPVPMLRVEARAKLRLLGAASHDAAISPLAGSFLLSLFSSLRAMMLISI